MEKDLGKGRPVAPSDGHTTRLLLVDDEEGFLDVVANRLAKRCVTTIKASSGGAALQTLRKTDVDVVVLDLKMEDMDGIEVLKIIRKMAPELPVIILTGHGSQAAARDGMALGAFDYLTKPCELTELLSKIRQAAGMNPTYGTRSIDAISDERI